MILCIETATTNCSVAIGNKGKLLALKEDYSNNYSHAERLHLFIQEILKENDLEPKDLSAIAVSKGPGSYTGLRIGVSAAKGLCFALDLPLISVPTLKTLALQVKQTKEGFIIPLLDARRMEVYTAGFNSENRRVFDTRAEILTPDSFSEYLENAAVAFIGSGVEKFSQICDHPNATFIQGKLPSAAEMTGLAEEKFQKKKFEDVAYFEPYYLKDFVAG
ncbi:tRNA (adenosine(37)-N6)-threonylcarbamoyltransferase complex dimerization subunit type 1 TsaB [Salinimicrobium xinjiangense]|uniref:tRNA (adenosine(37)-N6)-threonylcarbamoyltransferase complex dimerization subunit type 1 TsaB n=1 Tax=Salinimicrobium xinjiangense TaxID=438596 RepID=UPI000410829C|nr:tRNA (adenosine(37)-N6)-threonylcarbamoyltransferase complex dimerization subunit type 1 TsaB [Salinimicrobium xinjiangense]